MTPKGNTVSAQKRPVAQVATAQAATVKASASHIATASNRAPVNQAAALIAYCHSVDVFASTRSPTLKTGPLPTRMLRTVRSTIRPSSLIQRRVHPPQNAKTPATTVDAISERRTL